MLERLTEAALDPLLAVMALCRQDPRPEKIDLGVGVFRDAQGLTPVMKAVKRAELILHDGQSTKAYIGPRGDIAFLDEVLALALGPQADHQRIASQQTPGGTGALRLGADLLAAAGVRDILLGTPCWANHDPIFRAAGLNVLAYRYFDPQRQSLLFDEMLAALAAAAPGSAVLLQASCHNPTGADLDPGQWATLAEVLAERRLIPLVDIAYQGLGAGLEEDVEGVRLLIRSVSEAVAAVSCSKSFGLYRERTGALFVMGAEARLASAAGSNMIAIARANYSMPPDHGAAVVRLILRSPTLRPLWMEELDAGRRRISGMRTHLAAVAADAGLDLSFLTRQQGMFSQLPLTDEQMDTLRRDHAIYVAAAGRINVAGLNSRECEHFVEGLKAVRFSSPG